MVKATKKKLVKTNFSGEIIYIGIDVHKKSWTVTARYNRRMCKTFSMPSKPQELLHYLQKHFPGASYESVYEAGFSGFWIQRSLTNLGIRNIVINAADLPTTDKERRGKSDTVDSKKLARELENGSLKAIYIPDIQDEAQRKIYRQRQEAVSYQTVLKQRIKATLARNGIYYVCPEDEAGNMTHWSNNFIQALKDLEMPTPEDRWTLDQLLRQLEFIRGEILRTMKAAEAIIKADETKRKREGLLRTAPGIGRVLAIALIFELISMDRFSSLNKLASYVGLVPSVTGSGEKERVHGISQRRQRYLRNLLIEAAWVAIRKDPALARKYGMWLRRMCKQKAIIRVAHTLLARIRRVWISGQAYQKGIEREEVVQQTAQEPGTAEELAQPRSGKPTAGKLLKSGKPQGSKAVAVVDSQKE